MWEYLSERCADLFAATARTQRRTWLRRALVGLLAIGTIAALVLGSGLLVPLLAVAGFAFLATTEVLARREALRRAATLPLDAPGQRPDDERPVLAGPTATSLFQLAHAVDAARRGRYAEAYERLPLVHRDLLRPDELRLLSAAQALIETSLDNEARAAELALLALPTGGDDLDATLGRRVLARAWKNGVRLGAIDDAWERAGVTLDGEGPLPRLRRLLRARDAGADAWPVDEARALAEEAEAVGDDVLASELRARAHAGRAYRD